MASDALALGPWSEAHFEQMSWHDNHVHGMRFVAGPHGSGELVLDIDYIVEWVRGPSGCRFMVVPATLRFRAVTDLRVEIDYAGMTAAMGPFMIDGVHRRSEQRERHVAQCWSLPVSFPGGGISFEAAGYEQVAWGRPVLSDAQGLAADERHAA